MFSGIDTQGRGFIDGDQAVAFFSNARLPEETLASIWDLSDINSEGSLNRDGFAVAMHLIRQQRSKTDGRGDLPTTLPPNLIPPSMRKVSIPPQQTTAPAFDNAAFATQQPKSASEDLFGLDALASPTPASATLPMTNRPAPSDPFGFSTQTPSSPALSAAGTAPGTAFNPPPQSSAIVVPQNTTAFRPFAPMSSFGQGLTSQNTGGSFPSIGSRTGSQQQQLHTGDDLLGDPDPDVSRKLTEDTTEIGNLSNQIGNLRTQTQGIQAQKSTLDRNLTGTSNQKRELETRLTQSRMQYQQEVNEVKSLEDRLNASRNDTKRLQQELAMVEGAAGDLRNQNQQANAALENDQRENAALKERLSQLNGEIAQLKPHVEKLRADARQQKGLVAINKKQLATSESERDKLKEEISTHEQEVSSIQQEISRLEQEKTSRAAELDAHNQAVQAARNMHADHENRVVIARQESQAQSTYHQDSMRALQAETQQMQAQTTQHQETLRAVQAQADADRARHEESLRSLQAEKASYEDILQTLRAQQSQHEERSRAYQTQTSEHEDTSRTMQAQNRAMEESMGTRRVEQRRQEESSRGFQQESAQILPSPPLQSPSSLTGQRTNPFSRRTPTSGGLPQPMASAGYNNFASNDAFDSFFGPNDRERVREEPVQDSYARDDVNIQDQPSSRPEHFAAAGLYRSDGEEQASHASYAITSGQYGHSSGLPLAASRDLGQSALHDQPNAAHLAEPSDEAGRGVLAGDKHPAEQQNSQHETNHETSDAADDASRADSVESSLQQETLPGAFPGDRGSAFQSSLTEGVAPQEVSNGEVQSESRQIRNFSRPPVSTGAPTPPTNEGRTGQDAYNNADELQNDKPSIDRSEPSTGMDDTNIGSLPRGNTRVPYEFEPIREIERDDSDSEDEHGLGDSFASAPSRSDATFQSTNTGHVNSDETDMRDPSRTQMGPSVAEQLPPITAQMSPPNYDQTTSPIRAQGQQDPNHFPPQFTGLLPSREIVSSPPHDTTLEQSPMSPGGLNPMYGQAPGSNLHGLISGPPYNTGETAPGFSQPQQNDFDDSAFDDFGGTTAAAKQIHSPTSGPSTAPQLFHAQNSDPPAPARDEFDDAFDDLSEAREDAPSSPGKVVAGPYRPGNHDFSPASPSSAFSPPTTMFGQSFASHNSAQGPPITTFSDISAPTTFTSSYSSAASSYRQFQPAPTIPQQQGQPSNNHDWDDLFSGIDGHSNVTEKGEQALSSTTRGPEQQQQQQQTGARSPFQLNDFGSSNSRPNNGPVNNSSVPGPDARRVPPSGPPPSNNNRAPPRVEQLGRAISMGTEHDDPILKSLTSMGYARQDALQALEKFDYNLDAVRIHSVRLGMVVGLTML